MFVTYKNGNYQVLFNLEDGTKIRYNSTDRLIPNRPESMDVKITNKCSHGCAFCHENSTVDGESASYETLRDFASKVLPFTEIAIGGGNILEDIPRTQYFLQELKKRTAIPSITVRQDDFIKNLKLLSEWREDKLIYGIGVSLYDSYDPDLIKCLKLCPTAVLHIIAGIIDEDDYENLKGNDLNLLILGYKNFRRGKHYFAKHMREIANNQIMLMEHFDDFKEDFKTVAFDNLALEQLDIQSVMTEEEWSKYYCGDDGQYTFYVDLVERQYARNSTSPVRANMEDFTPQEMFNILRGVTILKKIRSEHRYDSI